MPIELFIFPALDSSSRAFWREGTICTSPLPLTVHNLICKEGTAHSRICQKFLERLQQCCHSWKLASCLTLCGKAASGTEAGRWLPIPRLSSWLPGVGAVWGMGS